MWCHVPAEEQNHYVDDAVGKALTAKQRALGENLITALMFVCRKPLNLMIWPASRCVCEAARGAALISQQRGVDEAIRSIVYTRKRTRAFVMTSFCLRSRRNLEIFTFVLNFRLHGEGI